MSKLNKHKNLRIIGMRDYAVTRLVHATLFDPHHPHRGETIFEPMTFRVRAVNGPTACRVADDLKMARENEIGWLKGIRTGQVDEEKKTRVKAVAA